MSQDDKEKQNKQELARFLAVIWGHKTANWAINNFGIYGAVSYLQNHPELL